MVVHQDIGMNFSIVSVRHLTQGIQQGSNDHWVSNVAVGTTDNELFGRAPGCEGSFAELHENRDCPNTQPKTDAPR